MTDLSQPAPPETSPAIADYEILSLIAEVEHGVLWQATPPARLSWPEPYVVVNVLNQPGTAADLDRMRDELSVHSVAESDHLVPMLEAGRQGETLFYSYGFSSRGGLVEGVGVLDRAQRILVIADIARAVHELHEVGLAHGDVHPGNIHVVDGRGRLSELGLTQVLRPGQTVTGVGENLNLSYRAPELLNGAPESRASDIFALGCVLHQVLAGRSPFPGLADLDLVSSLRFMLAPVPEIESTLTPDETAILTSCLAIDPTERPGTAASLATQLDELVVEYGGSL